MIDVKLAVPYLAPSVADIITKFENDGDLPTYIILENVSDRFGTPASIAMKYQESNDGSSWVDIVDTDAVVDPGLPNGQLVTSNSRWIAVFAGGNAQCTITTVKQVNGSPDNMGGIS